MSYMHIENLYKNKDILLLKQCYAMEKIHGTSAHISYNKESNKVNFSAGGEKYENFIKLFDVETITKKFVELGLDKVIIYGEAYGGKCQGMSKTYGKELKFITFEVRIGDNWLCVPQAEAFVKNLGLEFVYYDLVETNVDLLDKLCSADSIQAIRNGCGEGHIREGIVLRPLIELTKNNGDRIIAKHKNEQFSERIKPPKIKSEEELQVLTKAKDVVDEWVTEMRLSHVLDNFPNPSIENTSDVIKAMIEDVCREAKDEIVENKAVKSLIGKRTAELFKQRLKSELNEAL